MEQQPGIHKSALCRSIELGWGTVSHHLRVLEQTKQIQMVTMAREVHVFPSGVPEQHMRWLATLRQGAGGAIVGALRGHPGAGLKELSEALGASRKVIRRHLTLLDEQGLVRQDGNHRPRYSLTSRIDSVWSQLAGED